MNYVENFIESLNGKKLNFFNENIKIQEFLKEINNRANQELLKKSLFSNKKKDFLRDNLSPSTYKMNKNGNKMIENLNNEYLSLEKKKKEIMLPNFLKNFYEKIEYTKEEIKKLKKEVHEIKISIQREGKDIDIIENVFGSPLTVKQCEEISNEIFNFQIKNEKLVSRLDEIERINKELLHNSDKKSDTLAKLLEINKDGLKINKIDESLKQKYLITLKKYNKIKAERDFLSQRNSRFDLQNHQVTKKMKNNLKKIDKKINDFTSKLNN